MSMKRIIDKIAPSAEEKQKKENKKLSLSLEDKREEDEKAMRVAIISPGVKATLKETKYEEPIYYTVEEQALLDKKTYLQRLLQTLQEYFPEEKVKFEEKAKSEGKTQSEEDQPKNLLIIKLKKAEHLFSPEAGLSPKISQLYSEVETILDNSIIADKHYYLDVLRGKERPISKENIKSSLRGDFGDYAKAAKYEVESAKDFDSIKNSLSHFLNVAIRYQIDLDKTTKASQSRVDETKSLRDSLKKLERCNDLDALYSFLNHSIPSRAPQRSTLEEFVDRVSLSGQRSSLVLTEFNKIVMSALAPVGKMVSEMKNPEKKPAAPLKPLKKR